jgi:hypothetical protein
MRNTNDLLRTRARVLACSAVLLLTPVNGVFAQNVRGGAGAVFETYRFSDADNVNIESLSLITLPFGAAARLGRQFELQVNGQWARGQLQRADGSEAELSGLTDTEVRLSGVFGRDAFTLTAIALLPTGQDRLTTDQVDLAGMIAADLLPFRISNWGTGGGLGLSGAVAIPLGEFAAGISVGYVAAAEFEPVADEDFSYRPGNQLHVRAALDRTFGSSGKAALQLTYLHFGADRSNGSNVFRSGDRLQGVASYAFATGERSNAILYAGYLHRSESEFEGPDLVVPSQNLLFAGAGARLPAGRAVVQPTADVRVLGREDGIGQGYTASAGASVEVPAGALTFVPTVRGRLGNVELRAGSESSFTGAEVGLTVRFGGPTR